MTPRSRSLSARCSEAALVHPWKFLLFQRIVLLLSTCIRHHSRHPLPQLRQLSHILPSRESMEYRGRSRFPRGDDRRRRLSLTFARGHQPELGQDGQTHGSGRIRGDRWREHPRSSLVRHSDAGSSSSFSRYSLTSSIAIPCT